MSFSPVLPSTGLTGWNFLKASLPTQTELFEKSPEIQRDLEYFEDNIRNIKTLDDFMNDRRIQKVALGAFGLGEEINKGAFVRKVLDEGVAERTAFARRINNEDYIEFATAFDFTNGDLELNSLEIDNIKQAYEDETFEIALGDVDNNMRLALNFQREISDLANRGLSEAGGWFKAMGSVPLRTVLESAFNMPEGFSQLDIDKQKELLSDKANSLFGGKGVEVFQDPENVETTIRRFLLQEQIAAGPAPGTPGLAALTILGGGIGSVGIENLLLSNAG